MSFIISSLGCKALYFSTSLWLRRQKVNDGMDVFWVISKKDVALIW